MKQTAVEWLEKILKGQKEQPFDDYEWEIAFNHAKEMEKEQIINARINGDMNGMCIAKLAKEKAEKYYNETFKSE